MLFRRQKKVSESFKLRSQDSTIRLFLSANRLRRIVKSKRETKCFFLFPIVPFMWMKIHVVSRLCVATKP